MNEQKKLDIFSNNIYQHLTKEEHDKMLNMMAELYAERVSYRNEKQRISEERLKEIKRKQRAEKIKRIFE